MGVVSGYQSNPIEKKWIAVKHILKYLKKTQNYMLMYSSESLEIIDYLHWINSRINYINS